eukprot:g10014.t1
MLASRACHLGLFAATLLGQHGWTSGATSCPTIDVSGVDDLDGAYVLISSLAQDPSYFRAAGTTTYSVYFDASAWFIRNNRLEAAYKTIDPDALHPVDITMPWSLCTRYWSASSCSLDAAYSQPVITCTLEGGGNGRAVDGSDGIGVDGGSVAVDGSGVEDAAGCGSGGGVVEAAGCSGGGPNSMEVGSADAGGVLDSICTSPPPARGREVQTTLLEYTRPVDPLITLGQNSG